MSGNLCGCCYDPDLRMGWCLERHKKMDKKEGPVSNGDGGGGAGAGGGGGGGRGAMANAKRRPVAVRPSRTVSCERPGRWHAGINSALLHAHTKPKMSRRRPPAPSAPSAITRKSNAVRPAYVVLTGASDERVGRCCTRAAWELRSFEGRPAKGPARGGLHPGSAVLGPSTQDAGRRSRDHGLGRHYIPHSPPPPSSPHLQDLAQAATHFQELCQYATIVGGRRQGRKKLTAMSQVRDRLCYGICMRDAIDWHGTQSDGKALEARWEDVSPARCKYLQPHIIYEELQMTPYIIILVNY
ncbi:hypothetical protein BDZ91DRAFT_785539 [Kalaharituber pfeilii]|nr:hypothetical protein BDZ91DRAFT_785539 [Kalaharituber pfeilii]